MSTFMQTIVWGSLILRVMVGLHTQVTLSFLIVGHTEFSPDWYFGLLKQCFPLTRVACLSDLERVVNSSAEANVAQLVGTQSGRWWSPYLQLDCHVCWSTPQAKAHQEFHHFSISASAPGSVDVRLESGSESEHISLLMDHTWTPSSQHPPTAPPSSLSLERQWYLYSHIREYCPDKVRDEV